MVKKKTTIQEEETLAEEVRNQHPCLYISQYDKSDPGYNEKEKKEKEKIAKQMPGNIHIKK